MSKIEFLKLCMLGFSKLWGFEKIVGGEFLFIFFGLQGLSLSPFIFFFFLCNFVSSIVWLSLLHQLWFWFSNLFHIFFSFIEFCLMVFNIRLLVCGSALLISFFLGLSLLPFMKCQFLHYICYPMKSNFWVNWSCPGDLFCVFGFIAPFALFYLSLSLSLSLSHTHTHTHTCLFLWCEYLIWQISWLKCPLTLIVWSHEARAIQTSHSD